MSSPSSSTPSKTVRIHYTDSLNDLELDPEDNIYKLNSDTLKRLIIGNKLKTLFVSSQQDTPEVWSDVASSSSEDSADESEPRSSSEHGTTSHQPSNNSEPSPNDNQSTVDFEPPAKKKSGFSFESCDTVQNNSIGDSNKENTSSVNLNNFNISKPEIFMSVPSDLESVNINSVQNCPNRDPSMKGLSDKITVTAKHEQKKKVSNTADMKQLGYKFRKNSKFAHFESVTHNSPGAHPECETEKTHAAQQDKNPQKYFKKKSFTDQNRPASGTLGNKHSRPRNNNESLNEKKCSIGGDMHQVDKKNQKKPPKSKKKRSREKKVDGGITSTSNSECHDNSEHFFQLTNAILKKRVQIGNASANNVEVGLFCKICNLTELNFLEDLKHFYESSHLSKNNVLFSKNHFCSICKLIVCCEKTDAAVENHAVTKLHLLLEKKLSIQEKGNLSALDNMVVQKFNCIRMNFQPTTNVKNFLVPYDSTEESGSEDEGIHGDILLLKNSRSSADATFLPNSNPLANAFVFPLKMVDRTYDDDTWVKFIGEASTPRLYESLTPLLSGAGRVKQCLTDEQSAAAYVQFENSNAVRELLKAHNDSVNAGKKPSLKLVKIDLFGGSSGNFRSECIALMSDKQKFMEMINISVNSMVAALSSPEAKSKMMELKMSVDEAIKKEYPACVVFEFGSQVTGLASPNSDFDLFVDLTGQMYWGTTEPYDEEKFRMETVRRIKNIRKILKGNKAFRYILPIVSARVPILKITHIPTDSRCDLSFKNGLCVENTKLICKYLNMNLKIRWIIVAVRYWAEVCALASSTNFTNYALTWMVLFYLMTKKLIPPVASLMDLQNKDQPSIQGWKFETTDVGAIEIIESEDRLLQGFFSYYAHFEYNELAICPRIGRVLPKNIIAHCIKEKMPDELQDYVNYVHETNNAYNCEGTICCIQDPLLLNHNITRQVSTPVLRDFRRYCDIANIEMLLWKK